MQLQKITLPLTALFIPLAAFGSWWVTLQDDRIEQLDKDVRANRGELITQQFEVHASIAAMQTQQAVMAQNLESIRQTLERLEKKIEAD